MAKKRARLLIYSLFARFFLIRHRHKRQIHCSKFRLEIDRNQNGCTHLEIGKKLSLNEMHQSEYVKVILLAIFRCIIKL